MKLKLAILCISFVLYSYFIGKWALTITAGVNEYLSTNAIWRYDHLHEHKATESGSSRTFKNQEDAPTSFQGITASQRHSHEARASSKSSNGERLISDEAPSSPRQDARPSASSESSSLSLSNSSESESPNGKTVPRLHFSPALADILRNRVIFGPKNKRLAIIMYMPQRAQYLQEFLFFMHSSWTYITQNAAKLLMNFFNKTFITPDLMVFCKADMCKRLPVDCQRFPTMRGTANDAVFTASVRNSTPTCWYIVQNAEVDFPYTALNAYIMFNRSDIDYIVRPYDYLLRTDIDCFLSPRILVWKELQGHRLAVGQGGYCDQFNMDRLKMIAGKLNLTHRGVHCVGSTWYGEPDLFLRLGRLTLNLTKHVFLNEFDPNAPGLESINFTKNREGEWIRWWRPVSLLYGAELSTNHLIQDFDQSYKQPFDASSCHQTSVWNYPHIHCWHDTCKFSKFGFRNTLADLFPAGGPALRAWAEADELRNHTWPQDLRTASIRDYCSHLAWNAVARYITHWTSEQLNFGPG